MCKKKKHKQPKLCTIQSHKPTSSAKQKISIQAQNIAQNDMSNKPNAFWKDPKAAIELGVAFLTLISVVLVGWSIYEMKLQRESAYKPVLAVGNTSISFSNWIYGQYEDGSEYLSESSIPDIISNIPLLRFKVENIGLGIAKNVKCDWSEDNYAHFSAYLKTNSEFGKDIILDEDGNLKIVKWYDEIFFMTNITPSIEAPFIKTDNSDSNFIEVDATVYGYLCALSSIGYFSKETQPELVLNIIYEDIYSKKYNAQVHIRYEISTLRIDNELQKFIEFKTNTIYSE